MTLCYILSSKEDEGFGEYIYKNLVNHFLIMMELVLKDIFLCFQTLNVSFANGMIWQLFLNNINTHKSYYLEY